MRRGTWRVPVTYRSARHRGRMRARAALLCGGVVVLAASPLPAQAVARPPAPLPGYAGARVEEGWLPTPEGVRLFYRAVGERGDTVVYVHGGPGTGMREGYDLEPLVSAGYVLILYDQRGAGYSTPVSDSARLGLAAHVADLEAVRSHFRLGRVNGIGISWGSAVLLSYADRYPERVGRLVFASPVSPTRSLLDARMRHLDSLDAASGQAGAIDRANMVSVFNPAVPDSALADRCREEWQANSRRYERGGPGSRQARGDVCDYPAPVLRSRLLARMAGLRSLGPGYDLRPALRRVRAQALVVEGSESAVPLDATRLWARELPAGRLVLIPGAGHRAWRDRPAPFFAAVDTFLRGRWSPGADDRPE